MDKVLRDGRKLTVSVERVGADVVAIATIGGVEVARGHKTHVAPSGSPVPYSLGGTVGLSAVERDTIDAMLVAARSERDAQMELMVPGWPEYERIEGLYLAAAAEYDRKSEYGYPAAAARAAELADKALATYRAANPATAAWALIQGYRRASNYAKAGIGQAAETRAWAGQDVIAAAEQMAADWAAEARALVERA